MKLLVIAAHTDDLIYGTAGTLLTHANDEKRIIAVCPIQRRAAEEVADALGASITFLDGEYRHIERDGVTLRDRMAKIMGEWLPDYVLCPPSEGDWSPDHSVTGKLAVQAAVESGIMGQWRGRVLRYPIPASTTDFRPNVWIALPPEMLDRKVELAAMMTRGAEGIWPREVVEWEVATQMRFAQQCGWPVRHAEAFDAIQRVPFQRLPERDASIATHHEAHMKLVNDFQSGNDYSNA